MVDIADMPSIRTRQALASDLPDIQECARRAYAQYVKRMGKEPAPMNADFKVPIAEGHVVVATCASQFTGYVFFYPESDYMLLENIAVLPEHAGRGIGKHLIQHVERTAREGGYEAVVLYTNEAMTENLAMYTKIGYIEFDRRHEAGFSRVFFRKQL